MMHWCDTPGLGWGGWIVPTLTMLVIFGGLAAVIVLLVRQPADRTPPQADRILAERFARGEIDEDEYRRRLQTLHR